MSFATEHTFSVPVVTPVLLCCFFALVLLLTAREVKSRCVGVSAIIVMD